MTFYAEEVVYFMDFTSLRGGALMTDMRTRETMWEGSTVLIMIISLVLALAKMNLRYYKSLMECISRKLLLALNVDSTSRMFDSGGRR